MDSTVATDNDPHRAAIELARNTSAGLQDAEEGNIHHDRAGDGGHAGQGISAEPHEAQEGNMNSDGAGDCGDACPGVPAELHDAQAGVIHGGGNGGAGQGMPAAQDAEEADVDQDRIGDAGHGMPAELHDAEAGVIHGEGNGGAGQGIPATQDAEEADVDHDRIGDDDGGPHRRLRGVAVALLELFRLSVIYFVLDLYSTTSFSLLELAKLCLSAAFIVMSIAVECLLLRGVVDEARADGILRATKTANALVLILVFVWCLFSSE